LHRPPILIQQPKTKAKHKPLPNLNPKQTHAPDPNFTPHYFHTNLNIRL